MKKFMKTLSLIMVSIMRISAFPLAFASGGTDLKFNDDGKFVILQFADCQDVYPAKEAMVALINESLDFVNPDLVVFTGDNVVTDDIRAYDEILNPVVNRGIPFTHCYGNHDAENSELFTRDDLLAIYQQYPGCLTYDDDPSLSGSCTHNLPIRSSDGSRVAFNIWMFDSGDYMVDSKGNRGYGCVRADQVEWYRNKSMQLETENGALVPSLAFQHIVPQEIFEIFYKSPIAIDTITMEFEDGSVYSYVPDFSKFEGYIFEPPCPSPYNFGQWDAFIERGDVLALAVGHDHTNCFIADIRGVDLINTPGASWRSYGNDLVRGCRVFVLDENDPWNYETYVVTASELAIVDGSQIPDKEDSLANYWTVVIFKKLLDYFRVFVGNFSLPF